MAEQKYVNVIDVFWDGWFNSFKTFSNFQNGVEQKSLQSLAAVKEWSESFRKQLSQLQDDAKKLTAEWKSGLQNEFGNLSLAEWTNSFEDLEKKAEEFAFNPSKASFELLSKSQAQLESILKEAIEQQQKNRTEVLKAFEGYVDQLKQTQYGALKSFELYNPLMAK